MFTTLRAYQLLPTLISMSLLISTVGPLARPACRMAPGAQDETRACHPDGAPAADAPEQPTLACTHEGGRITACCTTSLLDAAGCCTLRQAPEPEKAALLFRSSDANVPSLALLPHTRRRGTGNAFPLSRSLDSIRFADLPSIDRQVLFSTFLT